MIAQASEEVIELRVDDCSGVGPLVAVHLTRHSDHVSALGARCRWPAVRQSLAVAPGGESLDLGVGWRVMDARTSPRLLHWPGAHLRRHSK